MTARKTWLAGGVALALISAPLWAQDEVTADTVVAVVGSQEITIGHMIVAKQALPRQFQAMPDDQLFPGILDQLIRQYALAQSLDAPTKATELTIENQRSGLLAGEVLGLVVQEVVTEDAIAGAYAREYADAEPSREFNADHILVETEDEANAVITDIEAGRDFGELARERSTGPSGPNGGALGWFGLGMMVQPFEAAVVALEAGEVSAPVQTQFGWHVIRLNETRLSEAPPLETVRAELADALENAAIEAHIDTILDAAEVTRMEVAVDPAILSDLDLVAE